MFKVEVLKTQVFFWPAALKPSSSLQRAAVLGKLNVYPKFDWLDDNIIGEKLRTRLTRSGMTGVFL